MRSIRVFAKNMGDPYYEPTIMYHLGVLTKTYIGSFGSL